MFGNDDYGGGGFDVSGFGGVGETPQGDKTHKTFKKTECVIPVTVRQILDSTDSGLKIGQIDVEAQMVKLVGIVKKINRSSVKINYTIQDNTGEMEGIQWLEADADDSFMVPVVENTYCIMVGAIRNNTSQQTQRHVMVFQIFPVTDLNEVTAHTLQVIYISLKSEELALTQPGTGAMANTSAPYGGALDSFAGANQLSSTFNLNPTQIKVLNAVTQNCTSELGKHVDEIMAALTVKMPMSELQKTIDFLCDEGHIFNTNDKCYKAADAF